MKCKFCGSSKTVEKSVQSEAYPRAWNVRTIILHNEDCIAKLTEKELLLMILEKLDDKKELCDKETS